MPKRRGLNVKAKELHLAKRLSGAARKVHEDRDLPHFRSPRAGTHSKIPGRGSHKAKP